MSIKNTNNRKLIIKIMLSLLGLVIALFYARFEVLTLLHGREFHNPKAIDDVIGETGAMVGHPLFIKVINYTDSRADILWVEKSDKPSLQQVCMIFRKNKSIPGQQKWVVETWMITTAANGSATCFFPWYGGIDFN